MTITGMSEDQIRERVNEEIDKWKRLQTNKEITFSEKAIDFIVEVVSNLELDTPPNWSKVENKQTVALALIPNALNDLFLDRYGRHWKRRGDIYVTSWDLWEDLSRILLRWCFIPKDV